MLQKKLEIVFIMIILIALSILGYNYYQSYLFKSNDIPDNYKQEIRQKEKEILNNMQENFGFVFKVPLIVTDKFKGRLYGLTSFKDGEVKIYLNKKVMQESMDYMIQNVIAHEYAHALMFKLGHYQTSDDGHSKQWQNICIKLGAKDCQQYVNQKEIILSKMPF